MLRHHLAQATLVAATLYTVTYPTMWLSAFAAIGQGAKSFASPRDSASALSLRGIMLSISAPVGPVITVLAGLGVFSSSTPQSTKDETKPSYIDFLVDPSWLNFIMADGGVFAGTHRLLGPCIFIDFAILS